MTASQLPATTESPLSEIHRSAGAELSPYLGVLLPVQFRAPQAEHAIARTTAALMDTNFRAVFSLSGPDRVRYLNAVTTGNIRDLVPGQGAIGLLLNSQGHILAELETLALDDRLLLLGNASVRESTAQVLDKFIIMDDAVLADETAQSGMFAIEGPQAPGIVRALTGVDLVQLPLRGHVATNIASVGAAVPCRVIRHSLFGFPGAEFLVAREHLAAAWRAADAAAREQHGAAIGYRALNSLRLEAGIPWFGVDFGEHQIPHEAGLESTHISFTKGCYTGQEIVERVRSRGHVNRRLTGLSFDAVEPPQAGATLVASGTDGAEGIEVGAVSSAANSPLLGKSIGMGYVRREYNKAGTVLQCRATPSGGPGNVRVEVIELPLPAALPTVLAAQDWAIKTRPY